MLRLGVKGYLGKDAEPIELTTAITAIFQSGYYYTDFFTGKLLYSLQNDTRTTEQKLHRFSERELEFMRLSCSEMTYIAIVARMFLSPKTVDGYRSILFERLSVKSRVGLVFYAIKHKIVFL